MHAEVTDVEVAGAVDRVGFELPSPLSRLPIVDRFPVSNFEHENAQAVLLNIEDDPIVPDSKPVVGGVDEPLDKSMGIL